MRRSGLRRRTVAQVMSGLRAPGRAAHLAAQVKILNLSVFSAKIPHDTT
jgi:hypothetical protein